MKKILGWFLLTNLLCFPIVLSAATVLVDGADPTTDNSPADCGEVASPDGLCDTIQNGIDVASPGDTVQVAAGNYVEALVVDKALTLQGAGQDQTVIFPNLSGPNPANCSGSICPGASNVVLVESSDVILQDLTVDGDNTSLTSGVTVGGVDVDARNGIITNHLLDVVYDNLEVFNVTVRNVYLRGIQASTGGSFHFHDNSVDNVQGMVGSIAIFNYGGSGVMERNFVSNANDAISSNWSGGVQFLNNQVVQSSSGIHTDNGGGPVALLYPNATSDLIAGNQVSECSSSNSYGIFVWNPHLSATVRDNQVRDCVIGLAALGQNNPAAVATFQNNLSEENQVGVLVTTSIAPFGSTDVAAVFTGNTVLNNNEGFFLESQSGFNLSLTAHFNRIFGNTQGGVVVSPTETGTYQASAENNWWGCNDGPNDDAGACDTVEEVTTGQVVFDPWLVLRLQVDPNSILEGEHANLLADVLSNSAGQDTAALGLLPDGASLLFATDLGSLNPETSTLAASQGSALHLAESGPGLANVSVTLDNQTVSAVLEVRASTTPEVTPGTGVANLDQLSGSGCALQQSGMDTMQKPTWSLMLLALLALLSLRYRVRSNEG